VVAGGVQVDAVAGEEAFREVVGVEVVDEDLAEIDERAGSRDFYAC
jgi:hypothetical protein